MVHSMATVVAVLGVLLAQVANAHKGCHGQEMKRTVNPGGRLIKDIHEARAWSSKRQLGKTIDIPGDPCGGYSYDPITAIKDKYPPNWEIATIQPGDTAASTLFAQLNATVNQNFPGIYPRGKPNGDWTGVTYDGHQDPACWWTYTNCVTPSSSTGLKPDIYQTPEPETYGLTYDDGPNCNNSMLYNVLDQMNLKATLFYIGSNVENFPLQAINGLDAGHEICVHTWSHNYMTALTNEQVFSELYYTRSMIKAILGITPLCWRPPFGDVDNRVRAFAAGLNLTTVLWEQDTADWTLDNGTPVSSIDANYQNIMNLQKNGTYATHGPIVLAHEITNLTMLEAIKWLPTIKSTFQNVVPVFTALNETHPYLETDLTYPTFSEYVAGNKMPTNSSSNPSSSSSTISSTSSTSGSATSTSAVSTTSAQVALANPSGSTSDAAQVARGGKVVLGFLTTLSIGLILI